MKKIKNHPYLSGGMEITLPLNEDNLPKDMQKIIEEVMCYEVGEEYGDIFLAETALAIFADANDNKKRFFLKVFASKDEGDSERTKIERELSLTPEEESYFFKEALHQVTENYLNIMENSVVCSLCLDDN